MLEVRLGDCIEGMAALDADSVDAVVCDPPYGLEFMGAEWDKFGASITRLGFDARPESRAFQVFSERWGREALRVLKPGGHLVAFGGSRTYHRLAAGVEDAGFDVRDQLMWIYGSGFPKSLDVSKSIDAMQGGEREVVGERVLPDGKASAVGFRAMTSPDGKSPPPAVYYDTAPATDDAKRWSGWATALKPAHEPIILARKPLSGTVAETVLEHGTGALNIAASKIGTNGGATAITGTRTANPDGATDFPGPAEMVPSGGRWPANVLLGHHPDCRGYGSKRTDLCDPDCPARLLDEQSGESVARFFYCAKAAAKERIAGVERSLHPTVKPAALMRWLVRLVTPPGGLVLDPFAGSGTTGVACVQEGFDFLGFDQDETYARQAAERIADHAYARGRKLTSPPAAATNGPSSAIAISAGHDNPEEGHDDEADEWTRGADRGAARERRPDAGQGRDRRGGQAGTEHEGQDPGGDAGGDDLHGVEEGRSVPGAGARRRRTRRDDGAGAGAGTRRDKSGGDAEHGRRQGRSEAGPEADADAEEAAPESQAEGRSDRLTKSTATPGATAPPASSRGGDE